MDTHTPHLGWKFWRRWVAITTIAWFGGFISAIVLSYLVVNAFYSKETNIIVGLCVGASIGISQVLVARRWLRLSSSWVWGAVLAMAPPFVAMTLLGEIWPGASETVTNIILGFLILVSGVLGSILQARALRPFTLRANMWIPACFSSWGLAWLIMGFAGPLVSGIALGAIGGALLIWILQGPHAQNAIHLVKSGPVTS